MLFANMREYPPSQLPFVCFDLLTHWISTSDPQLPPSLPCSFPFTATDRETGRARGFAHIEFATPADAQKAATAMNGQNVDGRDIKVEVAAPRQNQGGARQTNPGDATATLSIFVKGFDGSLGEDAVRSALTEVFGPCGEITRMSLPSDR
jgi:RNA recognition motif-containing protein